MLVALLLLGVVAALTARTLPVLSAAQARAGDGWRRAAELEDTLNTIRRDLRFLNLAGTAGVASPLPVLVGEETRVGGHLPRRPDGLPGGWVVWRVRDGGLERLVWDDPAAAIAGDTPARQAQVLRDVTALRLRYLDATGAWHPHWPPWPEPRRITGRERGGDGPAERAPPDRPETASAPLGPGTASPPPLSDRPGVWPGAPDEFTPGTASPPPLGDRSAASTARQPAALPRAVELTLGLLRQGDVVWLLRPALP